MLSCFRCVCLVCAYFAAKQKAKICVRLYYQFLRIEISENGALSASLIHSKLTNSNAIMATQDNGNAPFEWLTNFTSLQHLLLPSKIVFNPSLVLPSNEEQSLQTDSSIEVKLNALHVGCGTSTVGESLSLFRENVSNASDVYNMQYGHVVNVDVDNAALQSMQNRWEKHVPTSVEVGEMDWRFIDFSREDTRREALDTFYQKSGGYFDLVLDKSTFDCLLCAESEAVTGLLCEVYRALRVPSTNIAANSSLNGWGGVYVLVTFHPVDFVKDMLINLPGADWSVHHEIIRREVEDVGTVAASELNMKIEEIITRHDNETNCTTSTGVRSRQEPAEEGGNQESKSAWSSGTFQPDDNYRRTISVFSCRRLPNSTATASCILNRDAVRQHVERCCDEWYKSTNPMVTVEREEEITLAFANATADKHDTLDLKQCYDILFTDAEKEHLEYDYFMEDWEAYCDKHDDITLRDRMSLKVALNFLREMQ